MSYMQNRYIQGKLDFKNLERKGYLIVSVADDALVDLESVFSLGRKFFHLDRTLKKVNAIPDLEQGWVDFGLATNPDSGRPDLSEAFWLSPNLYETVYSKYPNASVLTKKMMRCANVFFEINQYLITKLISYFGVDPAMAASIDFKSDSDCQLLYYTPSKSKRDILNDPHEDGLLLTYLKSTGPGLEVLENGVYRKLEINDNQVVIIAGEILTLMSGGCINPLFHRVVRDKAQDERLAFAYFAIPNLSEGNTLSPWVESDMNEGVDILERARHNNYKFDSDFIKSKREN